MGTSVDVSGLAAAIIKELEAYSEEVAKETKKAVKKVAEECKTEIENNSPVKTGNYKKGWRTKVAYDKPDDTRVIVHNATDYQLTHLLEYGHGDGFGGRVEGKPHIEPAEKHTSEKLEKTIEEAIKK